MYVYIHIRVPYIPKLTGQISFNRVFDDKDKNSTNTTQFIKLNERVMIQRNVNKYTQKKQNDREKNE